MNKILIPPETFRMLKALAPAKDDNGIQLYVIELISNEWHKMKQNQEIMDQLFTKEA